MFTAEPCRAGVSATGSVLMTVFSATSSVFSIVTVADLEPVGLELQPCILEREADNARDRDQLRVRVEVHLHGLFGEDQCAGDRVGAMHEADRHERTLLGEHLVSNAERVEIGCDIGEQLGRVGVVGEDELGRLARALVVAQRLEQEHAADDEHDQREERPDRVPPRLRRVGVVVHRVGRRAGRVAGLDHPRRRHARGTRSHRRPGGGRRGRGVERGGAGSHRRRAPLPSVPPGCVPARSPRRRAPAPARRFGTGADRRGVHRPSGTASPDPWPAAWRRSPRTSEARQRRSARAAAGSRGPACRRCSPGSRR